MKQTRKPRRNESDTRSIAHCDACRRRNHGCFRPSTGGTDEPNDQPHGDVFFENYGVNPRIDAEDDSLPTFAVDVDTASYTVMRRLIRDGYLPDKDSVRVEEYVNFFE